MIGVIPDFLKDKELAHPGVTEMVVVPDMHTRKRTMFERADAFCILPGGLGTMDEAFEIITWRQLHLHNKPSILLNVGELLGAPARRCSTRIIADGFAHRGHEALLTVVDTCRGRDCRRERELADSPKPPGGLPRPPRANSRESLARRTFRPCAASRAMHYFRPPA